MLLSLPFLSIAVNRPRCEYCSSPYHLVAVEVTLTGAAMLPQRLCFSCRLEMFERGCQLRFPPAALS